MASSDSHVPHFKTPSGVFAIEGNIGVGKTHMMRAILALDKSGKTQVLPEPVNHSLLALFYADPHRYAFALQMTMLEARKYQREKACQLVQFSSSVDTMFLDRSKIGDAIFATLAYLLGNLTDSEYLTYINTALENTKEITNIPSFAELIRLLAKKNAVTGYVFLVDKPEACHERLLKLRKHASESTVPLDYLIALDELHLAAFLALKTSPGQSYRLLTLQHAQYYNNHHIVAESLSNIMNKAELHEKEEGDCSQWTKVETSKRTRKTRDHSNKPISPMANPSISLVTLCTKGIGECQQRFGRLALVTYPGEMRTSLWQH